MKEKTAKLLKILLPVLLAIAGALGGYLYYRFVGCVTGTCAITSDPYISTIYGGILGLLLGFLLSPGKRKPADSQNGD